MGLAQYERRSIDPVMNNRLVYIGGEYATSFVDAAADLRTVHISAARAKIESGK